jgi:hypothetical protein
MISRACIKQQLYSAKKMTIYEKFQSSLNSATSLYTAGQTHLKKLASVAGFRRKTDDFQPVATQKISL